MSMVDILAKALCGPSNIDEALKLARTHPEQISSKLDFVLEDFINFVKKVLIESTLKGYPNALIPIIVIEAAVGKSIGNPDYLLESLQKELDEVYEVSTTTGEPVDIAFTFELKAEPFKDKDYSEEMMKTIEGMVSKVAEKGGNDITITNETICSLVDGIYINDFVVLARKRFPDWTIAHATLKHENEEQCDAITISWT